MCSRGASRSARKRRGYRSASACLLFPRVILSGADRRFSCRPERRKTSGGCFSQPNPTIGRATPQALGSTKELRKMLVDPFVASLLGFAPAEQNFDSDLQAKGACKSPLRVTRGGDRVGAIHKSPETNVYHSQSADAQCAPLQDCGNFAIQSHAAGVL